MKVYLYKEESARSNALIKHIKKYNPGVLIEQIADFNIDSSIDSSSYYFILNEKGIQSFHTASDSRGASGISIAGNLNLVFPTIEQSQLETSKLYCRQFLEQIGLEYLNPDYRVITKQEALDTMVFDNQVIKADGLAAGKGVFVWGDHFNTDNEGRALVAELLEKHNLVLLEEKLEGDEFSCISLAWRGVITHFPLVRDFKRLEDGDQGPNTGGMGTVSFSGGSMPFLTDEDLETCRGINETVIIETGFRGFLYGSFMKTRSGLLKVIEYNVRLGDSEAVNIMELLDSSLLDHLELPFENPLKINMREYTFFRYLVPRGYARAGVKNGKGTECKENLYYLVDCNMPPKSFYLANSNNIHIEGASGVSGLYKIGTSRTCGVFSRGCNVADVVAENDKLVQLVYGDLHYRRDIGTKMIEMVRMVDDGMGVIGAGVPGEKVNYLDHLDNYNHIITDVKKAIDQHNLEVERKNPGLKVLGQIGDFANSIGWGGEGSGICRMICSVDGAGTKTKFLEGHPRRFEILGRDIVVHNINDMFCNNGRPVALLDYYGCDRLNKAEFAAFISGALDVCREYGIALIGGETAEMRGIFQAGEVEVLGILLGVLEGARGPENGDAIRAGNWIYGLESHGAHTNGFTKLREVADRCDMEGGGMPLEVQEFFSQPHRCYVPIVKHLEWLLAVNKTGINITGKAHITGGGFKDNIERILPSGNEISRIELNTWSLTTEWQWLFDNVGMDWDEFIRVFNAGWGFCVVVDNEIPEEILADIESAGVYGNIRMLGRVV